MLPTRTRRPVRDHEKSLSRASPRMFRLRNKIDSVDVIRLKLLQTTLLLRLTPAAEPPIRDSRSTITGRFRNDSLSPNATAFRHLVVATRSATSPNFAADPKHPTRRPADLPDVLGPTPENSMKSSPARIDSAPPATPRGKACFRSRRRY